MCTTKIKKIKFFIVLLLGCILFSGKTSVHAAENKTVVPLVVKQYFEDKTGSLKEEQKSSTYIIKAMDSMNPMPDNSVNNEYTFKIDGKEGKCELPLTFDKTGVYKYQIVQKYQKQENYTWDDSQYNVEVYIKNADPEGLEYEVIVKKDTDKKCDEIAFHNLYNKSDKIKDSNVAKNDKSNKTNTTAKTVKTVKTGDSTRILLWAVCGIVSFVAIITVLKKRNKR